MFSFCEKTFLYLQISPPAKGGRALFMFERSEFLGETSGGSVFDISLLTATISLRNALLSDTIS